MPIKVYKRTDASRDIPYQDNLLSGVVPPDAPVFFDDERDSFIRKTRRAEKDELYCASLALFADDENDLVNFLKGIKERGHRIICAEESFTWSGGKPIGIVKAQWLAARKAGSSMRGAIKSAQTKKAKTAAALALIYDRLLLPSIGENTTEKLCAEVGISRNSIKNHYGLCREDLRNKHDIIQKRKERRNAKKHRKGVPRQASYRSIQLSSRTEAKRT